MVYKFCRDRKRRRVYPIIGRGNANQTTPRLIWSKTPTRTKNSGDKPFTVGVDTAKDDMSSRLAIAPSEDAPTARAVHFPAIGLSADYFDQLTSEHAVTRYIGNRPQRKWEPKQAWRRNEAWDCLIYALAARLSLPIKLKSSGERFAPKEPEDELESHVSAPESPEPEQVMPPSRAFRPQRTRWNAYR
jgi:phage terminase large subunit GpA-like protein